MEKLKGMEALGCVFKRVSDGCEVIQCMLEFYKEMGDVERSYAVRMSKLCQSTNYTFHSNILTQWLGSEPFEEIGTLKHSWQKLGNELLKLASMHAEKAEAFHEGVRQPLQDLLPELEEERKQLKQRKLDLENDMKLATKRFHKIQKNYFKVGDNLDQLKSTQSASKFPWSAQTHEKKLSEVEKEFKDQEIQYQQAHRDLLEAHRSLNKDIQILFTDVYKNELKRVETVSKSLQEFARTLSNTAPAYLESMQRIVLSVDEINGEEDVDNFVSSFPGLHKSPEVPHLELHKCSASSPEMTEDSACLPEVDNEDSDEETKGSWSWKTPSKRRTSQPENLSEDNQKSQFSSRPHSSSLSSSTEQKGIHDEKLPPLRPHTVTTSRPIAQDPPAKKRSTTHYDQETHPVPISKAVHSQSKPSPPLQTRPLTAATSHPTKKPPIEVKSTAFPEEKSTALPDHTTHQSTKKKPVVKVVGTEKPEKTIPTKKEEPTETRRKRTAAGPVSRGVREGILMTSSNKDEVLAELLKLAQANDCYSLLGVCSYASKEELSRARREITAELHPDHYEDPQERQRATEKLQYINQVFHNVLFKEESRKMYDQMCKFREKYSRIVQQEQRGLEIAKVKLSSLHSNMKKARFPLELLNELQLSIKLIDILLGSV